jgi:hypothetical protein
MEAQSTHNAVAQPHPDYDLMAQAWDLIDDLMGGTRTMKERGEKWLPREDGEEPQAYRARLSRSVLFNATKRAVNDLSRRPFAKPATLINQEKLPALLQLIADQVDDEGRNLTQFCHLLLVTAMKRGLVHILVDYPEQPPETFEQERDLRYRPLLLCVDPKDLIGWQFVRADNGEKRLTQIRLRETTVEPSGAFGTIARERVRVINETTWELWQKDEKGDWLLYESGDHTLGKVGLVTIYLYKTGFMTGESPVEDLAWKNLAHYQSLSDHRNNLRFFRTGLFLAKGLSEEDMAKRIVVGVTHVFKTTSDNADIRMVEHSGAACDAGEKELDRLERQMDALSRSPLILRQWGNDTAMGQALEEGKSQCELQGWVREIEGGVIAAYRVAGEWVGEEVPGDVSCDIYDDFGLILRSEQDLAALQWCYSSDLTDRRTTLEGMKMRGVLPENADVDEILRRKQREGPALGDLGREPARQSATEEPA